MKLKNPIIPGFYPDPSICRVGDDFYIACSSFELYPGIPIFHSRNLVHWKQIGYAMTQENGFHVTKNSMVGGVMAPTIRYNDGTFYIINANFSDRGNYIITAQDPAGPWSEPVWLDDVPGIDASIFFDDDGKAYILGTGDVWDNGAGVMERGIWMAPYDIKNFRLSGEPVTIFNSAMRCAASPEAPHLYHVGDYYYLVIAEGGTEHYHSVAVARSRELFGFYENNPANPVMTHRHMGFTCPITNVGHADLVQTQDGSWYAVMLASRLIDGKYKNLGRETFICPVVWEREWPLFSPDTGKLEWEYDAPENLWIGRTAKENLAMSGNETSATCVVGAEKEPCPVRYDFEDENLGLEWTFWGTPYEKFYKIEDSKLYLRCIRQSLTEDLYQMGDWDAGRRDGYAAFLAQRQCEMDVTVTCRMSFMPEEQESAGLAIVQAMNHQIHLERLRENGCQKLRLAVCTAEYEVPPYMPGFTSEKKEDVLAETDWNETDIVLQLQIRHEEVTVRYGSDRSCLREFCIADAGLINPEKVGCMSGTIIGMYATGNGKDYNKYASFDWFEL